MTNQDNRPIDPVDLRQKAEAHAGEQAARTHEDSELLSPEEIRKTLHELRVHQIELEMQNEEINPRAKILISSGYSTEDESFQKLSAWVFPLFKNPAP